MTAQHQGGERRVAIVTGGSSGIGRAISLAFARLGWSVAVGARRLDRLESTAKLVRDAGGDCFVHPLDVTDPVSIGAFFDAAEQAQGIATVVVSNAGIAAPGRLHEMSVEHIVQELNTTLLGSLLVARRAIGAMGRAERGDLVFITSDAAIHEWPGQVPYAAAKAGLEQAARVLRVELQGTGIRSQFVRSGPCTDTEIGTEWHDSPEGQEALASWVRHGLLRYRSQMRSEQVADAVVAAVTLPPDIQFDVMSVSPVPARGAERIGPR